LLTAYVPTSNKNTEFNDIGDFFLKQYVYYVIIIILLLCKEKSRQTRDTQ